MKTITVQPQKDFLKKISNANPCDALTEIIWNGFDANSNKVDVVINKNGLDGIQSIEVHDYGDGIDYSKLNEYFGQLGGSWKKSAKKYGDKILHGENGQGRLMAYSLGSMVEWITKYKEHDKTFKFTIKSSVDKIEKFEIQEEPIEVNENTGTSVIINNISTGFSFPKNKTENSLARKFCLYLSKYKSKQLFFDGNRIDPYCIQESVKEYDLGDVVLKSGVIIQLKILIVQWKSGSKLGKMMFFCNKKEFALDESSLKDKFPSVKCDFSVYAISDYFSALKDTGTLTNGMDGEVMELEGIVIKKVGEHFLHKELEGKSKIVEKWIQDDIYPYDKQNESDLVKTVEMQVFDILAMNVCSHLNSFNNQNKKSKKFTFRLLRQAIENNPNSVQKIINEILGLNREEQDALANLLEKTTLSSIIKSAKIVENRLNFIQGLENLIFDKESKNILLERDQLHKILESETWLFSEDFSLANSEVRLEEVLAIHLEKLGERKDLDSEPVLCPNGRQGRVDLMLSKSRRPREGYMEYLVIELKRPSQKITNEVLGQVERYALAVANDARFQKDKTKWTFIAVSNEMDEHAKRRANQRNSIEGRVFDDEEYNIEVWAMTWSDIFHRARTKLEFFSSQLDINISRASAATYLKEIHGKFIPKLECEKIN